MSTTPGNRNSWGGLAMIAVVVAVFATGYYFATRIPPNDIAWATGFEQAKQLAAQRGQPMLLYFSADWCPPCRQMRREVWPRDDVEQMINAAVVPVYINVDEQKKLAKRYGATQIPMVVMTTPQGVPYFVETDDTVPVMSIGYADADRLRQLVDLAVSMIASAEAANR